MITAPLGVDDGDLQRCIACGLCLPHCPTWRVTGQERASPRGRIAAMRAVQWHGAPLDDEFQRMMEECVQCRGCEPVCPAFVPFGHLMEGARAALHEHRRGRRLERLLEGVTLRFIIPRHRWLRAVTWVAWALQRLRVLPRRLPVPPLEARALARPLRPSPRPGEPVVLFPGCVMDAWLRDVHRATVRVLESAGAAVSLPQSGPACCGALHLHAGRRGEARALARRLIASLPGEAPVLVNSAGCGAVMKDYGRLVGTPEAAAFAARVLDVHEWLAGRTISGVHATGVRVVVQDPCHLRHVQRVHGAVRAVLGRAYQLVETGDDGLCCGAGGLYSLTHTTLARRIRERKVEALRRAGGPDPLVASANPGCLLHLAGAGVRVRHPMELLAAALEGP